MNKKIIFSSFLVFVLILSSCGQETAAPVQVTESPEVMQFSQETFTPGQVIRTPVVMQFPRVISTQTPIPFPTILPSPTNVPPYPTASKVKTNAVVFVAQDWQKHETSSLWVTNVDGSGERKIVDSITELENGSYRSFVAPTWSPNGKWIGYISNGDLWIVSPDGSLVRKILSISDKNKEMLYTYKWSPNSSQIAYAKGIIADAPPIVVGIIDVTTGETSELLSYQSPPYLPTLLWSPDGRYLLLRKYFYFFIFDTIDYKIMKEIQGEGNCTVYHRGAAWSPNGQWFYHIQVGNGRFATTQICVAGLDGSNRQIDIGGTATSYPVWDKTGNFLYFVAANTNFSITPIPDYDLRLMRYDVRSQKQERLFSLGKEPRRWGISISPDGRILELHTTDYLENPPPFVFIDIQSLSVKKFNLNLVPLNTLAFSTGTAWAPDNKNIIIFAGTTHTPDGVGVRPYGAFYTLNSQTGEIITFSGNHNIELEEWVASPITMTP